jgi:hypothetical protein
LIIVLRAIYGNNNIMDTSFFSHQKKTANQQVLVF